MRNSMRNGPIQAPVIFGNVPSLHANTGLPRFQNRRSSNRAMAIFANAQQEHRFQRIIPIPLDPDRQIS